MFEATAVDVIRQAIQSATDDLNKTRPPESRFELCDDSILIGAGGTLDSLGLVSFLVALEERLSETAGMHVPLLTERNLALQGPLRSVSTMITYINDCLQKN